MVNAPSLGLVVAGNGLVLSWPAEAAYFTPWFATNFSPPIAWSRLPNPPALWNGFWQVATTPPSGGGRFFRFQIP